jgi:hypothetical protein
MAQTSVYLEGMCTGTFTVNVLLTTKIVRNEILHDQRTKLKDTILSIYGLLKQLLIYTECNLILNKGLLGPFLYSVARKFSEEL